MKRALDAAAEASGRSLSQEAEQRLQQSFREQDLLPQLLELAYGSKLAEVALLLEHSMRDASFAYLGAAPSAEQVEATFISLFNHLAFATLKGAVATTLDVLAPTFPPRPSSEEVTRAQELGKSAAAKMLERVAHPHDPTAAFGSYSLLQRGISNETKRLIREKLHRATPVEKADP
jgi:hypothetical protein